MKKSNVLIMLLLAITLVFVGCSSDQESDSNENNEVEQSEDTNDNNKSDGKDDSENQTDSRLSDSFVKAMQGEEYTIKYRSEMEIDGKTESFDTTMAISGDNSVIESESPSMNMHTVFIQKDDMSHLVNHSEETVINMPYDDDYDDDYNDNMDDDFYDDDLETDDMEFSTSGRGEFKGETYDYEEYSIDDGYIRYYFDGNDLVGMEIKDDDDMMTWEILDFSENVDESLFEIPEGYQTIDMGMGME